jgi:hypothetical protein
VSVSRVLAGRAPWARLPASVLAPRSFVSLLLWEGRSLTYVAEQAGHSVATLARHYAGTMRELET